MALVDEEECGLAVQRERGVGMRDEEVSACASMKPGDHAGDEGEFDYGVDHEEGDGGFESEVEGRHDRL